VLIVFESRRNAVGQNVNVETELKKIMGGLAHADVGLYPAEHDLVHIHFCKAVPERFGAARTERFLFEGYRSFGKAPRYLLDRGAKAFRILFRNEYRNV